MAQLNVNPQKVEELIKRFYQHSEELKNRQNQINNYINQLQQYWNDSHYFAFKQQFEEYHKLVLKANEMAETLLLPNLKNIKQFAERYQNLK